MDGFKVNIKPPAEIARQLGLTPGGKAQAYWTQRVAAHLSPYLPFRAANSFGAALDRGIAPDYTSITIKIPQARYLYHGKLMVGEESRSAYAKPTEKKVLVSPEVALNYTQTHNAKAGPYWDKRMVQDDGKVLEKEWREFLQNG